jgi:hypothetical protein
MQPIPAPANTITVSLEEDYFTAGDTRVHTLDEIVAALKAQQAGDVHLCVGDSARENYERVGWVVYGLSRHGFRIRIVDSNGVVTTFEDPGP